MDRFRMGEHWSDPALARPAFALKIPTLWGVSKTAPHLHDNSARTLEDVVAHYNKFFEVTSDFDGPGPQPPLIVLTPGDQADIVAYMKLLE